MRASSEGCRAAGAHLTVDTQRCVQGHRLPELEAHLGRAHGGGELALDKLCRGLVQYALNLHGSTSAYQYRQQSAELVLLTFTHVCKMGWLVECEVRPAHMMHMASACRDDSNCRD